MNIHKIILSAIFMSSCMIPPSLANDSTIGFDNYGIVFKTTEDIEMKSEYLYISPSKIEVNYEFFNKTTKEIIQIIAFPLPEIEGHYISDVDLPLGDFTTTVDGQIIDTELEERAFLDGKEISGLLTKSGVPLNPEEFIASKIEPSIAKKLESEQAVYYDDYENNYIPNWSYKRTYYRKQTFPPQAITRVRHQYTPSINSSILASAEDFPCPDKDTKNILQRTVNKPYARKQISYILTTGGNWAGGVIGDFRLVVDKESERNFVNFCGDGVKKIGPTQFEMRKKNFVPKEDLTILILDPYN